MTILKVEQLTCGYDKKPIVKDVSFAVHDGEFVGIVGPNGSGKTTLLRALIGLLKVKSGSVIVGSHRIENLERKELAKRLAFVPQLMEPVVGFTVEEYVLLGRTPYFKRFSFEREDDHKAVDWAIEELKLEAYRNRQVTELSGGEFQRVAIARALAQKPRALLLDEPTSHLDIRYQVSICKLLRRLRSHRSIIATFHDLNLAARFCDRLILLKNGQLVAEGAPGEVITPKNIWQAYHIKVAVRGGTGQKIRYVAMP
ncbi:MAG: ABC transporter ATP-binding protein [Candidatus Margulisbacteria bacterium]|nr:ABC transporter ATP-binding protein [Candidatus Margulisiibacteriota bacterium]